MSERPLWAPWRIEYITGTRDGECIFCELADGKDARGLLLERGERCLSMLNAYPYASGHVMVAPCRHVGDLEELDDEELLGLMHLTRRALQALREVMAPDGFNAGLNLGVVAGAGIADHLHMHVVPRWEGDNNFMPVLADIRVLPQALAATREALAAALERMPRGYST
jgi:ATP adenylyltransferase